MRYSELKQKEVINICDGKRMGSVVDLEIDESCGDICAIVVPSAFSLGAVFRGEPTGIVIPWHSVVKIGDDAILVEVDARSLPHHG